MSLKSSIVFNQFLLLITAMVWGVAFVAQRSAMNDIGPLFFNGIRFLLGGLVLLLIFSRRVTTLASQNRLGDHVRTAFKLAFFLCTAAACQQIAMITAEAGKAGFITSLYLVFIPVLLLVLYKEKTSPSLLFAIVLAVFGMYLLCDPSLASLSLKADSLLVLCALLFAGHMVAVGKLVVGRDAIMLASGQFVITGVVSLLLAFSLEDISLAGTMAAWLPILYAGLVSCAIGYTLQVVAQEHVATVPATIIMSLEAVFGVIGGVVLLGENLTAAEQIGCVLLLLATLLAQVSPRQLVEYVLKQLKRNRLSEST
jgi:drug/metabolite transporter (DMT)-like permease